MADEEEGGLATWMGWMVEPTPVRMTTWMVSIVESDEYTPPGEDSKHGQFFINGTETLKLGLGSFFDDAVATAAVKATGSPCFGKMSSSSASTEFAVRS